MSPIAMKPSTGRILELDALRGLAAVSVVLYHYTSRFGDLFGHSEPLPVGVCWGQHGVNLFFMLSGFVILMTLDRSAQVGPFIWSRFTRLYPAYWAAMVATFAVVTLCGLPGQEVTLGEAILNMTMVQSLLGCAHVDGAYWSLQAEILFYANMLVLYRMGVFARPVLTVLAWVGLGLAVVLVAPMVAPASPLLAKALNGSLSLASLRYIPLFGIGILLYSLRAAKLASPPSITRRTLLVHQFSLVVCFCGILVQGGWETTLISLALARILWGAVTNRLPMLKASWLIWLGAISYPLYLTHQNIGYVLLRWWEGMGISPPLAILLVSAVALLMAVILHRLVEKPALKLLRQVRFAPSFGRLGRTGA